MQEIFPGEVFANTDDFDQGIRQLLPHYDEMLEVVTRCLPSTSIRILELGCGTGELSLKILERCPNAQIIALDYSPRMVQFALQKITASGYQQQWRGIEADFGDWAKNFDLSGIGRGFDACVSSFAIHHLSDEMKSKLFQSIRESLNPQGYFWNADPVLPESPILAEIYKTGRENWTSQQGINLTEVRQKVGSSSNYGYSSQDQLATLESHLKMLVKAGFNITAVPWKFYGLAVFGGSV
jgi:tRNA (cmo5U34)-methyltransferase